jgi:hypothetical protein
VDGPRPGDAKGCLVRASAVFHKGKLLERPIDIAPDTSNSEPQNAGSEVA